MVRTESGTAKRLPRHLRNEDIPSHTFTPRTYQVELLDAALQKNTIVCLGSSGGNTFLSVMLLKEFSTELRKQLQNEGKRSVVCLSSDDRIQEMCQVIKHHSDLNVISLPEALEEESDSKTLLNDHQILVTKPSVFSDLLLKNILLPGQISLVILENCHLVLQQDHPYQSIMKIIHSGVPKDHSCRILGLTSSFISQKCQDPEELGSIITSLEDHYHAKAETATLVIAERYGIRPKEYLTYCDNYEDMTGTLTLLDDVLSSALEFLRDCNMEDEEDDNRDPKEIPIFVFTECLHILYTLGPWCASCIANMFINQIEKVDKHEMVSIHKKFLKYCLTHLRIVTTLFEQNFTPNYDVEELLQYSTPRVYQLVNHLRKYKPDYDFMIVSSGGDMEGDEEGQNGDSEEEESEMSDDSEIISDEETDRSYKGNILHIAVKKEPENENQIKPLDPLNLDNEKYLCGIIFVDHRYVALAINKFLEEVCSWDENLCFVKSQHLTGQGLKDRKSKKGVWKKQEDVLRKFRLQDLNLLISTTVLEDGIDVPKCNLIVKFDPPRSYKSYSQSKGRARARDSEYLILVEENKKDTFMKDYSVFKGIESVLIGKKIDDEESDVEDCLYENGSSVLPSYLPNAGNPQICVTMNTAIAFVNRYCAKLPSDAFTHLTPKCTMQETCSEEGKLYVATLSLPINSPYKHPVQGEPMPTKNLAKKAVALKLCECLHKAGELDDQLNPVGKEVFSMEEEEEEEDLLEMEDGEDFSGEGRPGTTKRKQYYFKKLAGSLLQSHPTTEECMLYNVTLQLSKAISDEQNTRGRKICAPEDTLRGFGILTSKPIPQVPTFPVYTRSGEVNASIDLLNCNVSLSSEELRRLREFHRFTFTNVLRLEKDPMEFCSEKSELGYLIVPLNKDGEGNVILDWGFIKKVEDSKSHIRRNIYDSKREEFVFLKEEYEDAVVMPSYRNVDQPQHFYVAEIRSDLNPSSPFPSPELYKTFCAYYTTKYGLTITNQDQPLLDVDHTSARLNLLTPRYMNQKGVALPTSSAETKKARRENLQQKQILVPELCEIHVFPASLWRKAVCLPTILYRLNYLLVADEIRLKIAGGTGIGLVKLEEGFRFQPLDFGFDPKIEEENGGSANLMNDNEEHDESINKSINGCDSGRASHISCDNNSFTSEEDACDTKKASCDREQNISVAFQNDKAANNVCDIQSNKSDHSKCGKNGFLKHDDEWVETLQDQSISKKLDKVHVISEKSLNEMTAELNEMKMTAELNEMNTHVTNSPSKNNQNYEPIFTDFPDVGVFKLQEKQCGHSSKIEDTKEDVKFPELSISLDQEVDLSTFVGPSPCTILQALTMSNANDFFSLERLETIGDSFLKYAITVYLYCTYPGIHEGKLSYLRSKQVSNCNLYRLGKRKGFAECMISTKFEPYENWLPPGYIINDEKRKGPVPKVLLIRNNLGQLEKVKEASIFDAFCQENASLNWIPKIVDATDDPSSDTGEGRGCSLNGRRLEVQNSNEDHEDFEEQLEELETLPERVRQEEKDQVVIPYNLQTLHSIPDKSIADCVESLIGCYLTSCGKKAALKFMHWLGLKVLPQVKKGRNENTELLSLQCPESPILAHVPGYDRILCRLLEGYSTLEQKIGYEFKDKSYLLQAFTHASYHYNTVTDCYQRLEFLGDAILDYVITRHLYEDSCKYSPGVLTDLRSALVNNNIFAALAVKWDFHKYFKAISPPLFGVIEKFVARQKEREDEIDLSDDEGEGEDEEHVELEVPKALGDIFESLAGAIYLDSGMSLDTVWKVYYRIMKPQIDKYLKSIPKSPVRELLEMEPETAKFEKPERTLEGKIRVSVNVVTKGVFTGVGRNYRIAKSAAAKKALRSIKAMQAGGLI